VLVEWCGALRACVIGWVPESGLITASEGGVGVPGGIIGGEPPTGAAATVRWVDAGTELLDRPGGTVIGRCTVAKRREVLHVADGHSKIAVWTEAGTIEAWVAGELR
jgi:hypothetical protein